ncbi:hypothetical protein GCM10022223_49590 [Kineosporia mesophila]|uniref:Cell division protein FtsL n=1 Tax=Kineosporia mesophila TaxID=566012 RepID=A0ABP7A7F7_9ACTN|nr:hypothetical protein [Kineosporia mesophila]MCD5351646.1 hypothetical protein [Kineosporia mesophila]
MSTSTATARVAPEYLSGAAAARQNTRQPARPPLRVPRPRLRVVPAPRRSRTGLALLCVGLLGAGLLALLLLNISIGKGAYELTGLQQKQRELADQQQSLTEQVESQGAPGKLAGKAKKLGMVPAPNPAFLDPDNGSVKGEPEAATSPASAEPAR